MYEMTGVVRLGLQWSSGDVGQGGKGKWPANVAV